MLSSQSPRNLVLNEFNTKIPKRLASQTLESTPPSEAIRCFSDEKHQLPTGRAAGGVPLVLGCIVLALGCAGRQSPSEVEQDCQGGEAWHDDDAKRFVGCIRITGDLKIGGALQSTAVFSELQEVSGNLEIGPSYQLTSLAGLSKLKRVGGTFRIRNTQSLSGLFLGSLEEVGASLEILGNLSFETVSLHSLVRVGASLKVEHNNNLQRLDLSKLVHLGGESVIYGRKLDSLVTPDKNDWEKMRTKPAILTPVY
ncbi:MAG: hypothetical protein JKY56_07660 [Kofleriaceae bacterium]|nr:hypothetical protein [Kofleriaceae bacterium]